MHLRDYLRIAMRRWKIITVCVMTCLVLGALVTAGATPQYASTTRLFVSSSARGSAEAYAGSLFSQQRVASYADLANGRELATRVIGTLGLASTSRGGAAEGLTPDELTAKVEAVVVPETVILQVTVTDPDPERAQTLAQAYGTQLSEYIEDLETPPRSDVAPVKGTVIDSAKLPTAPITPQPVRNMAIALLLGLIIGSVAAVVRELLDNTIKSAEEAAELSGTPVMATITEDPSVPRSPVLRPEDTHTPRSEMFRMLRTNLQFVDVDKDNRIFVLTSSLPGEGKSSTVVNLGISMVTAGFRVLLIEGDLRRPTLARTLELENAVGLTTVLVGSIPLHEAIQRHHSGMQVLTSGVIPPNPSELLQSNAMNELLTTLRGSYDIVLIDSPPLLPVTDAALLAAQSDGALLVVRHGRTTREQLTHSLERLRSVDARAIGVVLNMTPTRGGELSYGYGYGYAPKSAEEQDEEQDPKSGSIGKRRGSPLRSASR